MSTGLIYLVGGLLLTALWITASIRQRRQFNDRWPSTTDDEFVARCQPATNRETALRVRKIVAEQLDVPYDRVHPDQSIVDLAD